MEKKNKRRMSEREGREENRVIGLVIVLLVLLFGLALYGYLSGAWEQ